MQTQVIFIFSSCDIYQTKELVMKYTNIYFLLILKQAQRKYAKIYHSPKLQSKKRVKKNTKVLYLNFTKSLQETLNEFFNALGKQKVFVTRKCYYGILLARNPLRESNSQLTIFFFYIKLLRKYLVANTLVLIEGFRSGSSVNWAGEVLKGCRSLRLSRVGLAIYENNLIL